MKHRIRKILLSFFIAGCLTAILFSCIENNLPYPTVRLSITDFAVDGQIGDAVFNNEERTITVSLLDSVDLKKVLVTRFAYTDTDGATADLSANSTIDLTSPKEVTLSLYKEYKWKIIAEQTIERRFKVKNQVGQSFFDAKNRQAITYVNKKTMLNKITVEDLKLGPISSEITPDFTSLKDFREPKKVNVIFRGETEEWTLYVFITDKVVSTTSVDGWTNVAWLYGEGQEDMENGFEIRESSSEEWTRVDQSLVKQDGVTFSACVPHLKEGTEYVCRAIAGEDYGEEKTFTTTASVILPGGTFDNWNQSGKVWNPWGENETPFWDTGNKGATTLGDSNTVPTDDIWGGKQTGKAAKLESKFVGIGATGKLAAGNMFVGKYVATDGTNGILSFGQPFTAYPTRLKGYYKYTPAIIDNVSAEYALLKGVPDTCSIYIAIGDWDSPLEIRTKPSNRKLFDKNDKNVIAYAEFVSGTPAAVYKEVSLELEYRATNRKPTYIIMVCSASKYGDFFTGASGSVLYVDELTLEYDY